MAESLNKHIFFTWISLGYSTHAFTKSKLSPWIKNLTSSCNRKSDPLVPFLKVFVGARHYCSVQRCATFFDYFVPVDITYFRYYLILLSAVCWYSNAAAYCSLWLVFREQQQLEGKQEAKGEAAAGWRFSHIHSPVEITQRKYRCR